MQSHWTSVLSADGAAARSSTFSLKLCFRLNLIWPSASAFHPFTTRWILFCAEFRFKDLTSFISVV